MRKRSKFSLSHYKLATMDMGKLVPVSWFEALPGDTIQMQTSAFVRVAPTLAPIMTPCHVNFMTFSVPLRLLWDNGPDDGWENFITGGPDGLNVAIPPQYRIAAGSIVQTGSLLDYLGVPAGEEFKASVDISAFPIRAYYRIWNEYFRDQDLQGEYGPGEDVTGGVIESSSWILDRVPSSVSWKKDYFTVARPFEQKGPAVTIPVVLTGSDGSSPLISATTSISGSPAFTNLPSRLVNSTNVVASGHTPGDPSIANNPGLYWTSGSQEEGDFVANKIGLSKGTLSATTNVIWNGSANTTGSITVDDIREAFGLQRMEEARALFGSRYVEYLRYLGVKSSDARLQRPEYLGGGSQVIQWSEVVQTAQGTDPVGTLRGHGVSGGRTRRWRRFFEEHCIVMTLAYIRPIALYTQSLPRQWSRTLKEDYWQKELQHIGQQEVLNKEIYGFGENPDGVFGYMDRYDEYRSVPSTVCGDFRTTLDYWHLGRVFSSQPVLNGSFIQCNPSKRIFSEQTAHEFYCMFLHSVQARRLIARKGRPGGL